MLAMIADHFEGAIISAPTNKACDVLRQKGFASVTTDDRVVNQTIAHVTHHSMTASEIARYNS
jgi:hypothetical protein